MHSSRPNKLINKPHNTLTKKHPHLVKHPPLSSLSISSSDSSKKRPSSIPINHSIRHKRYNNHDIPTAGVSPLIVTAYDRDDTNTDILSHTSCHDESNSSTIAPSQHYFHQQNDSLPLFPHPLSSAARPNSALPYHHATTHISSIRHFSTTSSKGQRASAINIQLKSLNFAESFSFDQQGSSIKSSKSPKSKKSTKQRNHTSDDLTTMDDIPSTKSKKFKRGSKLTSEDVLTGSSFVKSSQPSINEGNISPNSRISGKNSKHFKKYENDDVDGHVSGDFYQPMGRKNPLFANREHINHLSRQNGNTGLLAAKSKVMIKTLEGQHGRGSGILLDKPLSEHVSIKLRNQMNKHSQHDGTDFPSTQSESQQTYHQQKDHRRSTEEGIQSKLKHFQMELSNLETQLTAPLQDIIMENYDYIQRIAVKSSDSKGNKKNEGGYDKDTIQLVENIAGGFHALEGDALSDEEVHNTALALDSKVDPDNPAQIQQFLEKMKQDKKFREQQQHQQLLSGVGGGEHLDRLVGADKWALPSIEGVSSSITNVYAAEPKIDPTTLPTFLKQIVYTAEKKLIAAQKENTLLENAKGKQKLLGESGSNKHSASNDNDDSLPFVSLGDELDFGRDERGNKVLLNARTGKPIDQTTAMILHQHISAIQVPDNDKKSNQIKEFISLKDNLPVSDAFLPPMTSLSPPSEMTRSEGGGLSRDAVLAVSLPDHIIHKQYQRHHIELHKKQYTDLIKKHGQKEGEMIFWNKYPLPKKKHILPKETDIHAKYMTLLSEQRDLIKEVVQTTGYGHLQQKASRHDLLNNLLKSTTDDHELLLLLKQANILNNDVTSLEEIVVDGTFLKDPNELKTPSIYQDGDEIDPSEDNKNKLVGKAALIRIAQQKNDVITYKQQKYDEYSWLNSNETIVLPYNSPDGFSDVHLPQTLRIALKTIEDTFNSLKNTVTPSATAFTNMLSMYGQLGLPARAAALFDEMMHDSDVVPDTTTYNVMLNVLQQDNKVELCLQLFENMRQQAIDLTAHGKFPSLPPRHVEARKLKKLKTMISKKAKAMGIDDVDFTGLIDVIKENPDFKGTYLHGEEDKFKPSNDLVPRPDVVTYTTVIKALGKARHKKAALKLFDQMRNKDKVTPNELTWTTAIDIACENNDFLTGLRLFHEMKQSGIKPTRATYSAMTTSAARGGEIALTTALLHEMMLMQQNNLDLYHQTGQQHHNKMLIDAPFIGSVMRSAAEGGNAAFSLKLHNQLQTGTLYGSGTIINGRKNQHQGEHAKKTDTTLPNAVTYNALLEVLADPASWGRTSLPPAALRIGLAVYQEALINKVFKHPYSEVQSTGVLDLRPYTRGAVLFPIHFYLNSLLGEVPVYNIDGMGGGNHFNSTNLINTANLDLAVQSIASRKAPSEVVGQSPYSIVPLDEENNQSNQPQQVIKFPQLTVPPKGVVFVANKEIKPMWSATPELANRNIQAAQQQKYVHSIEYVENILRHTKPWLHFTRLQHAPNNEKERNDGGSYSKKTVNNPNSVLVSANGLRHWVGNQTDSVSLQKGHTGNSHPQIKH